MKAFIKRLIRDQYSPSASPGYPIKYVLNFLATGHLLNSQQKLHQDQALDASTIKTKYRVYSLLRFLILVSFNGDTI